MYPHLERIFEQLIKWCFYLAGASIVFLMSITVIDIVLRQIGLISVRGTVEMSTMAVVLIGFLALSHSFVRRGHIVVDLVTQRLPAHINRRIDAAWLVMAAVVFALMALLMWRSTIEAFQDNDVSLDLQITMTVFWIPASIGMSLAPVACLLMARRYWTEAVHSDALKKRSSDTT